MVSARSVCAPTAVVVTRSALLRRDVSVISSDGAACVRFTDVPAGSYYVSFRHRNHLGAMTAQAVSFAGRSATVNFSLASTATYKLTSNDAAEGNSGGLYSLWPGNANLANTGQIQTIIYQGPNNDPGPVFQKVLGDPGNTFGSASYIHSGYDKEDVNLDGYTIYQGSGNDPALIAATVNGYPGNTLQASTYTVSEQVPVASAYMPFGGGSATVLQTVSYHYHVRGWLRGMNLNAQNNPGLTGGKLFSFRLGYEEDGTYYDGNIHSQQWVSGRDNGASTRQYAYGYDKSSRLTAAAYVGGAGESYSLGGITYDVNGNLTALIRSGIDQLTYSYGPGNSLTAVSDAITGDANVGDFRDGNPSGVDYEY